MKKSILLVAVLVMILGSNNLAIAQTMPASSDDTPILTFYDDLTGGKYYYFDPDAGVYYVLDIATGDVYPYPE